LQEPVILTGARVACALVLNGKLQTHHVVVSLHSRNSPANSTTVSHDPIANPSVLSGTSASEDAPVASEICATRRISRNSTSEIFLSSNRVRTLSSNGLSEPFCGSDCSVFSCGATACDSFFGSVFADCASRLAVALPLPFSP